MRLEVGGARKITLHSSSLVFEFFKAIFLKLFQLKKGRLRKAEFDD